jgi:hypothetical protein
MNPNNPIIITMKYPYDNESLNEAKNIYEKVKHKYKEVPPFELFYASTKKIINLRVKVSNCILCKEVFNGEGLYFPIENNLIIPYGCCEKCVIKNKSDLQEVYVGTYVRSLKYYTWKMIIGSNLYEHYYNQVLKEEEELKKKYNEIIRNSVINKNIDSIKEEEKEEKEEEEDKREKSIYQFDYDGKEGFIQFHQSNYFSLLPYFEEEKKEHMYLKWFYVAIFSIMVSLCSYLLIQI